MIKKVNINHVNGIVDIHLHSFEGFFLSFLGPKFLHLYYEAIADSKDSIAFMYIDDLGRSVGMIAGSVDPGKFYSHLLKTRWYKFIWVSFGAIIRRPSIILRLLRAVFYPSNASNNSISVGLFSIGVLPEMQGRGIGKKLMVAFLEEVKKRGRQSVVLTTDRDNNVAANQFYEKSGFSISRQYVTREKRRMNEYLIDLNNVDLFIEQNSG